MALDELLRLIRGAGKRPVERDALYRVVREFDGPGAAADEPVAALAGG